MAAGKSNLLDPGYWEALVDMVDLLERKAIPYAVVGGGAAQLWNAALLTEREGISIDRHPDLPLRLRSTRDLDISTNSSPQEMLGHLNELAATARQPVAVLSPRAVRLRHTLINLTLEPADVQGLSALYQEILDSSVELALRRGGQQLALRVENLEHLMVTKLTRKGNQTKDLLDMDALCTSLVETGQHASAETIRELLGPSPQLFDSYLERFQEAFQ